MRFGFYRVTSIVTSSDLWGQIWPHPPHIIWGWATFLILWSFVDWRPPSAQNLHFKVLGIVMGTFWAPLPKIWHGQKVGQRARGDTYKIWERLRQAVWSLDKNDNTFWTTRRRRTRRTTTLCALRSVGFAADKNINNSLKCCGSLTIA